MNILLIEMLKPQGQNFGLGLVISGLSLWTLSPRSQAFGLGLKI